MNNIEELYNRHAVKIVSSISEGSGCIIQPSNVDYSYVFTAKHCLTDNNTCDPIEVKVTRCKSNEEQTLEIKNIFVHPEYDIAIITIEKVWDIRETAIFHPAKGQHVAIYGYPFLLKNQPEPRQNINCRISFHREFYSEIISEEIQFTFEKSIPETIKGFSGSGVFYELDSEILIVGIFTKLKIHDGAYNTFCSYNIDLFEQFINENNLTSLNTDNFGDIIKDYTLINNVFSISYNSQSAPYYSERESDISFKNYLNNSKNIWISGKSGVGKTLLVLRNLNLLGKNSIHIDLTCSSLINIEDYFEYINNELIRQCNLSNLLDRGSIYEQISDNLRVLNFKAKEIAIFVDEVPISEKVKFYNFLSGFISISERFTNLLNEEIQIKWIVSTRINPIMHLRTDENCLPNKVKAHKNFIFKNLDLWNNKELSDLMYLLQESLNFSLSANTLTKILQQSYGLPGRLKSIIERTFIEDCSIEKAIEIVKSENN